MPLTINYAELELAMSSPEPWGEGGHYFDTQTGNVLLVSEWVEEQARQLAHPDETDDHALRLAWSLLCSDGELDVAPPAEQRATLAEWAEAYSERFLQVPSIGSRAGYRDMVVFASSVTDPHLRELLDVALQGRGAFRRFKDVLLRYPEERQRWFAFSDQRLRKRVDEWLRRVGVLPAGESEGL